jgi:hypothetical protein
MPKQRNRPGQTIPDTQPFNPPLNTTRQKQQKQAHRLLFPVSSRRNTAPPGFKPFQR